MAIRHRIRSSRDEGQVLVLFALASFVLIGCMALALDVGYLLTERREAQNAVDAAALAGGVDLIRGESDTTIVSTALDYADENGVTNGANGATVSVNSNGNAQDGEVIVEITNPVQEFFLGVIYTGDWEVTARAVAKINDDHDGEYALIALEQPGMYVNGNMTITVENGSAMSNGDVDRSGGSNAFVTDGTIDAYGVVDENDNWYAPGGFNDRRPVFVDPLVSMKRPSAGGLTEITQAQVASWGCAGKGGCTLLPGYYMNINFPTIQDTAHLLPGVYYFEDTTISLQNNSSRIEGEDVMLYFTGSSEFIPKNGEVSLTAPDTSDYGGVDELVVWIENCSDFDSQGNGEFYVKGLFYAPCSDVWLHGNPNGETLDGQFIAGTIDIRGTSDMLIKYRHIIDTPRLELYLAE